MVKDLNVRPKTMQPLEENTREKVPLYGHVKFLYKFLDNNFFDIFIPQTKTELVILSSVV